jgi:hypothetical protein
VSWDEPTIDSDQSTCQVISSNSTLTLNFLSMENVLKDGRYGIDYRCDDRRFWLSTHDCQVPTSTSQNLDLEEQIRICEAD